MAVDKLMKKRSVVRSSVTRLVNKLLNDTSESRSSTVFVLNSSNDELRVLNNLIFDKMLDDDASEELLELERADCELYEESVYKVVGEIKQPVAPTESTSALDKFKLQKIKLKVFNLSTENWISFWEQFSKIDSDETLSVLEKFHYLIMCLEPGSNSHDLVSNQQFELSYTEALESLKMKYGREDLLIDYYVRDFYEILNMDFPNLIALYVCVKSKLELLASLGITSDKYGYFLLPCIERYLPDKTKKLWETQRLANAGDLKENLKKFMLFFEREAISEDNTSQAPPNVKTSNAIPGAGPPGVYPTHTW